MLNLFFFLPSSDCNYQNLDFSNQAYFLLISPLFFNTNFTSFHVVFNISEMLFGFVSGELSLNRCLGNLSFSQDTMSSTVDYELCCFSLLGVLAPCRTTVSGVKDKHLMYICPRHFWGNLSKMSTWWQYIIHVFKEYKRAVRTHNW